MVFPQESVTVPQHDTPGGGVEVAPFGIRHALVRRHGGSLDPFGQINLLLRIQPGRIVEIQIRPLPRHLIRLRQTGNRIFHDGLRQGTGLGDEAIQRIRRKIRRGSAGRTFPDKDPQAEMFFPRLGEPIDGAQPDLHREGFTLGNNDIRFRRSAPLRLGQEIQGQLAVSIALL